MAFDLDHAVAHFGNFLLHEPAQQIAMGAAELDHRARVLRWTSTT